MTLWVFGDSFTECYSDLKDQWIQRVATELQTNVMPFGLSASSLEYTYTKYNQNRDKIKDNDVVIVALTGQNRRWFFKYYPGDLVRIYNGSSSESYKEVMRSPKGNPKEEDAIAAYADHLDHNELQETYLYNFLYNLNYQAKKKNVHTIVLINLYHMEELLKDKKDWFPNLHFNTYKMLDIFLEEFSKNYLVTFAENPHMRDIRVNHMIRSNHIILADKIIDNIKNKALIELDKGFVTKVVSEESMKDPEFIDKELFQGYLLKLR